MVMAKITKINYVKIEFSAHNMVLHKHSDVPL